MPRGGRQRTTHNESGSLRPLHSEYSDHLPSTTHRRTEAAASTATVSSPPVTDIISLLHYMDNQQTRSNVGKKMSDIGKRMNDDSRKIFSAGKRKTQRVLEHTLQVLPDSTQPVNEVLDILQTHIKSQRNEAIRRWELFTCKQMEGESFDDFYVKIKRASEEVDICAGHNGQCEETQLKQVILMGLRDEELVQKLILLDTAILQGVVTICRSFEAAKTASSAICTPSTAARGVSQYKKVKKKTLKTSSTPSEALSNNHCPSCGRQLDKKKCPTAKAQCLSCGRKGHWSHTTQCLAKGAQCKL